MHLKPTDSETENPIGTLATTSDVSLTRAEEIVFGDTVQLVDWRQNIAWIIPILSLEWEPAQMVKFEAERMARLRSPALENFERASLHQVGKPHAYLQEVDRLRVGVSCYSEAPRIAMPQTGVRGTQGDKAIRDALWDSLEDYIHEIDQMRSAYRGEVNLDIQALDQLPRQRLEQADKLISSGLLEEPLERARILREARRNLKDLTLEPNVHLSPAVWACYAWLTWQLTANEEESMIALEYGTQRPGSSSGPGYSLCARLYAYLHGRRDHLEEAYQWAEIAQQSWPCLAAAHEKAHFAARLGRQDLVRRDVEVFFQAGSMAIPFGFGDEALAGFGTELIDAAVREQLRIRQLVRQELSAWEAAAKKAALLIKKVPTVTLPQDLVDGFAPGQVTNEEASFLVAGQLLRRATGSKEDLKCLALAAVQSEKRKRQEALMEARRVIEAATEARDNWMKASMEAHEESVRRSRAATSKMDGRGDTVMRGCSWGLSTGCGVMAAYLIIAMVLSIRGVSIGLDSLPGRIALGLAIMPVALSVAFHLIHSVKRLLLEAQINAQVAETSASYERAREEANIQFRDVIESSQNQVAEEEKHLQRVEEALKIF